MGGSEGTLPSRASVNGQQPSISNVSTESPSKTVNAPTSNLQNVPKPQLPPPPPPPKKRDSTDDAAASTETEDTADETSEPARKGQSDAKKSGAAKKKKANRACAACQRAHLTCDDARPCTRCVKKGIGDQCTDGKRKRAKYLLDEDELEAVKAKERAEKNDKGKIESVVTQQPVTIQDDQPGLPFTNHPVASGQALNSFFANLAPVSTTPSSTASIYALPTLPSATNHNLSGAPDLRDGQQQQQRLPQSQQQISSGATPPYTFGSEATSLEYSILSAMLNGIDPSLLSSSPDQDLLGGQSYASNGEGVPTGSMTPSQMASDKSLDLSSFLARAAESGGQVGMPSVGVAAESASYPFGLQPSALGSLSSRPSWTAAQNNLSASDSIGQLHPIGGQDTDALEGEVGSGGFKALEVPSPSPSLVSSRLDGQSPVDSASQNHFKAVTTQGKQKSTPLQQPQSQQTQSNGRTITPIESQLRERVKHIYGDLTKPFPYTEGYHFLLKFVTDKFEKAEVLRIVRALGLFRPSLIALQMPLTEEDEVFVERSIQRTILEFEKLISFSGTPTVVWRRTCEICVVGSEFSMLTGWTRDMLLGRRIYEFWDKGSTLEYWEKFASHAFENTSQSIVAKVVLERPDGTSVPCAACFSIKRNVFDLPSLVVGAFLPILSGS